MKILGEKLLNDLVSDPLFCLHRVTRERVARVREPYVLYPINRHGERWVLKIKSSHRPRLVDDHMVMKLLWAPGLKKIEQVLLASRPLERSEIGRISKILLFSGIKIKSDLAVSIIDRTLKWFPELQSVNLSLERYKTYEPLLAWSVHCLRNNKKPVPPRRIGVGYRDKGSLSGPSLPGENLKMVRKEQLELFESILLQEILSASH